MSAGHPRNRRLRRRMISVAPYAVVVDEHADLTAGEPPERVDSDPWLTYHEWAHTGQRVARDGIGRLRANSWGHRWLVLRCNNGDCPARVDIREDVLHMLANSALRDYQSHRD